MSRAGPLARARARYVQARDDYLLVFVLILFVIVLTAVTGGPSAGGILVTAVQTVALLLTLRTAGVRGRSLSALRVLGLTPVLAAIAAVLLQRSVGPIYYASTILLVLSTQAAIGIHAVRRRTITLDTVMAALCVYLLLGLLFATLDAFFASLGAPFFAQAGSHPPVDYVYFSFVTLTTVGYGDLTPGPAVARILAMTEALLGQLYLVTVIALLVGNLGAQRLQQHAEEGEQR